MVWTINHHFVDHPCAQSSGWRRGRCWVERGPGVAAEVRSAVTAMLGRRGIDYDPALGRGEFLWCLGGSELYRNEDLGGLGDCVDLNLSVCDKHEVLSVYLFGAAVDLVPEWGGTSADDPLRSEPILLPEDSDRLVDELIDRIERWLDETLILPKS